MEIAESAAQTAVATTRGAPTPDSLAELVSRMAGGSQSAMSTFYEHTVDRAYAVARSILRSDEDAEEAMMEAYLQAWRTADRYVADRAGAITWLLMMVRSRALDLHRRRAREDERKAPAELGEQVGDEARGPDELVGLLDDRSAVARALKQLTPPQLEVIALGFFRDLSHVQISEVLNMPLGTVKSHARRAMLAMRTHLEAAG